MKLLSFAKIFKASKKSEKEISDLKPFDKVLVRDHSPNATWHIDLYSHSEKHYALNNIDYVCIGGKYLDCIPYNEKTKHLVGKKQQTKPKS